MHFKGKPVEIYGAIVARQSIKEICVRKNDLNGISFCNGYIKNMKIMSKKHSNISKK